MNNNDKDNEVKDPEACFEAHTAELAAGYDTAYKTGQSFARFAAKLLLNTHCTKVSVVQVKAPTQRVFFKVTAVQQDGTWMRTNIVSYYDGRLLYRARSQWRSECIHWRNFPNWTEGVWTLSQASEKFAEEYAAEAWRASGR